VDFSRALNLLKQGYKIHRPSLNPGYLILSNKLIVQVVGDQTVLWIPNQEDLLADDWEATGYFEQFKLDDYRSLPQVAGVYSIRHRDTKRLYIGYSNNIRKRGYEHLKALLEGRHWNEKLQEDWWIIGDRCIISVLEITDNRNRELFHYTVAKDSNEMYNMIKSPKILKI
jgi:hypothetical protein